MEIVNQYLELVEGICRRTETFSLKSKLDVCSKFYPNNPMSWQQYFQIVQPQLRLGFYQHPIIKNFSEEVDLNCYKISKNQEQAIEYRTRLSNTVLDYINPALSALERCRRRMRFSERYEFTEDELPDNFFLWLCSLYKESKDPELYSLNDLELDSVGDAIHIIQTWKKSVESVLSPIGLEADQSTTEMESKIDSAARIEVSPTDTTSTNAEREPITSPNQLPEPNEPRVKLTWQGDKKVLFNIIRQLKNAHNKKGQSLLKESYDDIARFLIQHINGFENNNLSTLRGSLTKDSPDPKGNNISLDFTEPD